MFFRITNDVSAPPLPSTSCRMTNFLSVSTIFYMRWAGHVARMEKREVHTGFWWGDLREGDHLGDPSVDGRIILKVSSRSGMWGHGLD
jgi:hypothetical protein